MRYLYSRRARCEECGESLDYEVGSPMWACQNRDLCLTCYLRPIMEQVSERIRGIFQKRNAVIPADRGEGGA